MLVVLPNFLAIDPTQAYLSLLEPTQAYWSLLKLTQGLGGINVELPITNQNQ
jgi:hypothetical protein